VIGAALGVGDVSIATAQASGGTVTIGSSNTVTTLTGTLTTALGTIAGKTAYFETNTNAIPATLDCTTVNSNVSMVFFSANTPSNAITINNIQDNQTLTFKNWSETSTPVTINFSTYGLYLYGTDNGTAAASSYSLPRGNSIVIKRISGKLYQVTPNNNFPLGLTAASDIKTTSGKLIGGTVDCVTDATAGNTSLAIGPSAVNGNIVIGAALGVGDVSIATAQASGGT
jgi:hypothetical protein